MLSNCVSDSESVEAGYLLLGGCIFLEFAAGWFSNGSREYVDEAGPMESFDLMEAWSIESCARGSLLNLAMINR